MNDKTIVFFDGVCGLCNRYVDFLLKIDTERKLLFAPIQGSTAKSLLSSEYTANPSTLILFYQGQVWVKSEAVSATLRQMNWPWRGLGMFRWVPLFIRDRIYDWVATNRYDLFGKKDVCRMPTPDERAYFLD